MGEKLLVLISLRRKSRFVIVFLFSLHSLIKEKAGDQQLHRRLLRLSNVLNKLSPLRRDEFVFSVLGVAEAQQMKFKNLVILNFPASVYLGYQIPS